MENYITRYCLVKNSAYNSVEYFKSLSDEEKIKFIAEFPIEESEKNLFITTLLLPNDIELLNLLKEKGLMAFIELSDKFNIPFKLFAYKVSEYDNIDLMSFIDEGRISRNSASQKGIYFDKENNTESFTKLFKM